MKHVTLLVLMLWLVGTPALAQQDGYPSRSPHKGVKLIVGIGALAVGAAVAAKSSQTMAVSSAVGTSETSSFSSSQLITGLAITGAGGILVWDALRAHEPPRPSTVWGVGVAKDGGGQIFWRRRW